MDKYTIDTKIENGFITRNQRQVDNRVKDAQGKGSTNGAKLVSMQKSKEEIERKVIDVLDYRILRKSGALKV